MCRIGLPDASVSVAPAACRRHHGIKVLPQVGVCRYATIRRQGAIVERQVEQLFAEYRNVKRVVSVSLLDAQAGRGLQPTPNRGDGRRLIA
jgi:hypothetical protein